MSKEAGEGGWRPSVTVAVMVPVADGEEGEEGEGGEQEEEEEDDDDDEGVEEEEEEEEEDGQDRPMVVPVVKGALAMGRGSMGMGVAASIEALAGGVLCWGQRTKTLMHSAGRLQCVCLLGSLLSSVCFR